MKILVTGAAGFIGSRLMGKSYLPIRPEHFEFQNKYRRDRRSLYN